MKKATLNVNEWFVGDRIFDAKDSFLNRDDQLFPYRLLRKKMAACGIELRTQDYNAPQDSEFTIYMEMPKQRPAPWSESYLLILEAEMIRPDNWHLASHKYFKKVFTWSDRLKGRHYVPFRWPQVEPKMVASVPFGDKGLCCMVAGAKSSQHPLELYSERIAWIKWFETNHPKDFGLYGRGWEQTGLVSWCGELENKYPAMAHYKFAICTENQSSTPGYITEKIFDCFWSGCVPVYLGDPNVAYKIPKNCFIDMRDFTSREAVYDHLIWMSEEEHAKYVANINAFLNSAVSQEWRPERFTDILVDTITKDL